MASQEEIFTMNFLKIGSIFKKELAKENFPFDCSMKECKILESLFSGPKTMGEIAGEMNLTPGTMTIQIDNMIEKKLVERTYDKNDRRKIHIKLSKKGESIAKILMDKNKEFARRMFSELTEDEKLKFNDLFSKAISSLEK